MLMHTAEAAPTIPGPDPHPRKPALALPPGSTDCHAHIVGPQSRYPYDPKRRYTPPDALVPHYVQMLRTLGVERGVLVQPSVYMTNNQRLVDALRETDFPLRGIAVVDESVTDAQLNELHAAGVRGLRVNLRVENGASADAVPQLARRIARLGWHMQLRVDPKDFASAEAMISTLPVDTVIDHIGGVPVDEGTRGSGFQTLLRMLATGRTSVKLSAPMRMSNEDYPYRDVVPFVHALVDAAPERLIWALDWPHTTLTKPMPNDGDLCDLLDTWLPDESIRRKVLVDNPARLFDF
jgi:predicted TIM-barrel fold metal-dependent hydrolase